MASHGRERYKIFGSAPEIEKLPNSRFRVIVRCDVGSVPEDWYYANRDRLWRDFGDLYTAPIESGDSWQAKTGEAYPNQALIAQEFKYLQGKDGPVVEFIYETLTDTWTNEDDDDISSTENGLRTLIRTQVALPDTALPYDEDDVGVSTITDGGKTLYLAGFEDQGGEQIGRVVSRWAEPGVLSIQVKNENEGVQRVATTFLVLEGSTTGDIIFRDIQDWEGLRTIVVVTLQSSDGTPLTDMGAAKLNYQYQQIVPFTFPGVVDLIQQQNHVFPSVRSPVEADVKADVLIYYQTSSNIVAGDLVLDGAIGYWNPSEWCQKISTIDSFFNDQGRVEPAYYNAQGIRGCRTREAYPVANAGAELDTYQGLEVLPVLNLEESVEQVNGRSVYVQEIDYIYDVTKQVELPGGGVVIRYGSIPVQGKYVVTCEWNGTQWEINYTDTVVDKTPTNNSGDGVYTQSAREGSGTYADSYTNQSSTASGTLSTSTLAASTPDASTWPSPIIFSPASREEEVAGTSYDEDLNLGIPRYGFWIEGRQVDNGAFGRISIRGGPPNPFGKRYVLSVNLKKAFEDIDGNTTYMKQVVVATCTPLS